MFVRNLFVICFGCLFFTAISITAQTDYYKAEKEKYFFYQTIGIIGTISGVVVTSIGISDYNSKPIANRMESKALGADSLFKMDDNPKRDLGLKLLYVGVPATLLFAYITIENAVKLGRLSKIKVGLKYNGLFLTCLY